MDVVILTTRAGDFSRRSLRKIFVACVPVFVENGRQKFCEGNAAAWAPRWLTAKHRSAARRPPMSVSLGINAVGFPAKSGAARPNKPCS